MKQHLFLLAALLFCCEDCTKGLALNSNQTHGISIEKRMDLLEEQLADEKREKYILLTQFDQEKQKIVELERQIEAQNETDQKLLQVYNTAPKRFQDLSTQIRGALFSVNSLDNKHSLDVQKLADGLKDLQTLLPNLKSNISEIEEIQRHFQEKGNVLSHMIEDIKHNQTERKEGLARLKNSLTSLTDSQTSLQSRVTNIEESVIFLAAGTFPGTFSVQSLFFGTSVSSDATVKFLALKINVGGGYSSTCPSGGYYV